jgi:hypothetical protein
MTGRRWSMSTTDLIRASESVTAAMHLIGKTKRRSRAVNESLKRRVHRAVNVSEIRRKWGGSNQSGWPRSWAHTWDGLSTRDAVRHVHYETGYTVLHRAARQGSKSLAQLYISHGADAGVIARDYKLASEIAYQHGHTDLAALLCLATGTGIGKWNPPEDPTAVPSSSDFYGCGLWRWSRAKAKSVCRAITYKRSGRRWGPEGPSGHALCGGHQGCEAQKEAVHHRGRQDHAGTRRHGPHTPSQAQPLAARTYPPLLSPLGRRLASISPPSQPPSSNGRMAAPPHRSHHHSSLHGEATGDCSCLRRLAAYNSSGLHCATSGMKVSYDRRIIRIRKGNCYFRDHFGRVCIGREQTVAPPDVSWYDRLALMSTLGRCSCRPSGRSKQMHAIHETLGVEESDNITETSKRRRACFRMCVRLVVQDAATRSSLLSDANPV